MKTTAKTQLIDSPHTNGYEFSRGSGYALPQYPSVVPEAVQSGRVEHHRVLIVGGGLAGLTLACSLAQLGVNAVMLDEDNSVGVKGASSRGICYTQKSLEIFDKLGIYPRIAAKGVAWSVGRTFAGADEVYNFDLKKQNNFSLSEQPAFINIQQFYIEGFLVERIEALNSQRRQTQQKTPARSGAYPSAQGDDGVEIRWNNRVTGFGIKNQIATFTIATCAGSYKVTADYVIDATGSRSPFRGWLGVGIKAKKGDDRWCIADVRFNTQPPSERHTWIEAPFNDNRAVWQHLMADQVWRIDYQMAPDSDAQEVSREDVVRERLHKQFGPKVQVEIVWVGPYAYRSECVHRMSAQAGKSTVFFVGDSAKVVSPFGARGGNSGIADADNLAWKLAAVVQSRAAPVLLDSYHQERHEAAQINVEVTNRTARFLRPADGAERLFRTAAIDLAKKFPFARALINTGRMAVANPYSASTLTDKSLASSTSVQNASFLWPDASQGCLNQLLGWAGVHCLLMVFVNVGVVVPPQLVAKLRLLALGTGVRVVVVVGGQAQQISTHQRTVKPLQPDPGVREYVRDPLGKLAQACAVSASVFKPEYVPSWVLLRPDSYLVAKGRALNAQLMQALARCAGTQM